MLKKIKKEAKKIPWSARLGALAVSFMGLSYLFPSFSTGELLTFFVGSLFLVGAFFKALSEAGITIKIETNDTKTNDT